jgi:hypothetical protein
MSIKFFDKIKTNMNIFIKENYIQFAANKTAC